MSRTRAGSETPSALPAGEGTLARNDARFDQLAPPGARLEKLAGGFQWLEGPVWSREGGCLLFSDIPANTVYRWKEGEGVSVFLRPSGYTGAEPFAGPEPGSNALAFDREGRLVLAEHGDRRIGRLERDGSKTTLAGRYQGKRLNSPNDLVFRSNGDLYFTDPPYGLPTQSDDDPAKELDFNGVFRLTAQGELILLTRELHRPNGIAFSPDEKTLYVAQSFEERAIWMAYPVLGDGNIGPGRVFFDATPWAREKDKEGLPDGLKADRDGNLFATGPGGIHVFTPEGDHLGAIRTGVKTANCAWGDDGSTLYITASEALYRIRLRTRGAGF
jgi:gluconolactonase